MKTAQVGIIGGGVIGSALARELSRYHVKTIIFEKGSDVATGASKANSGVLHSGINSPPGSLKAELCVKGNKMFPAIARDLSLPLRRIGKLIVAKNEKEIQRLYNLKAIGEKNSVQGLQIIDTKDVQKKEKNVKCTSALWVPSASITLPYLYTIALAENAAANGVKFQLNTTVNGLKKKKKFFHITTNQGTFKTEVIINAAGIYCKDIVSMVEKPGFNIYPCRGQYLVLDKKFSPLVTSMIYPIPDTTHNVLGIHITPTIDGNILLGPSAEFITDPTDTATTWEIMTRIYKETSEILPALPLNGVINAFSGVRCRLTSPQAEEISDFKIEKSSHVNGMINLLGIESPGLTAAPAIAHHVIKLISHFLPLKKKNNFHPRRHKRQQFDNLSQRQRLALIKKDNTWGNVVCRCEQVTEAEVIQALCNPLHAHTFSAIKYRCRAGMGRCQGGFCTQHLSRIMQEKLNIPITSINLGSSASHLFVGWSRVKKS